MRFTKHKLWLALLVGISLAVTLYVFGPAEDASQMPSPNPSLKAHLDRSLAGHSALVWEVAFSPDGRYLGSASVDRTVRLWHWPEATPARDLTHPEGVTSFAFSPDGRRLASSSYDQALRVWRVEDGVLEQTLTGHSGAVWTVAFSPDGQRLASGGEDKTVKIWRLSDGALLQSLEGHTLNIWSVAFSQDGGWLASGSFDRTAKLWRADTGALVATLLGHTQAIVSLAFSPDSQLLATGGDDSTLRLWRVEDGGLVRTLTGGSEHVYGVAFSPDGQWLASGSREKGNLGTLWKHLAGGRLGGGKGRTVRLWQVRDGALQQSLAEHSDDVHSVAFSTDGKWLASSGEDSRVNLWRLASSPPQTEE